MLGFSMLDVEELYMVVYRIRDCELSWLVWCVIMLSWEF